MAVIRESNVEEAALEWFGELGYSCLGAEALALALCLRPSQLRSGSHGERESYGEVVLVGRLREAIRWLRLAVPQSRTLAILRDTLLPKLLSGELGAASSL